MNLFSLLFWIRYWRHYSLISLDTFWRRIERIPPPHYDGALWNSKPPHLWAVTLMTRILREGMALPFFAQVKVHYRFFSLSFPLWLFTPTLISFSSFFFCLWDKVAESMDLVLFFPLFRWQVSPPIALRTWPNCPLQYRFSPPSWISFFKFLFCAIYLVLHFSDWSNNTESKVNVDTLSFFPVSQSPPPSLVAGRVQFPLFYLSVSLFSCSNDYIFLCRHPRSSFPAERCPSTVSKRKEPL